MTDGEEGRLLLDRLKRLAREYRASRGVGFAWLCQDSSAGRALAVAVEELIRWEDGAKADEPQGVTPGGP